MNTFDEEFNESWLTEMPMGITPLSGNLFDDIVKNMKEFTSAGLAPEDLGAGYRRVSGTQVAFYWHQSDNVIDIIVELGIRPQSLVVQQIAKNPRGKVSSPATDLYNVILKSNNKSIVLMSDEYLTDQGLTVWKRLINLGHTISVYDRENPSQELIPITTQRELEKFCASKDPAYKRYRYVLSETNVKLAETKIFFNTKRLRILSGYPG